MWTGIIMPNGEFLYEGDVLSTRHGSFYMIFKRSLFSVNIIDGVRHQCDFNQAAGYINNGQLGKFHIPESLVLSQVKSFIEKDRKDNYMYRIFKQ